MIRNYRKPLVIVGPKTLLRHPQAVSALAEMAPGTSFRPVLSDVATAADIPAQKVQRVVFVSGKHFYALNQERQSRKVDNMAILRLEVSSFDFSHDVEIEQ
jgi:probable 2-oxoglutarate dehydrogenase E1 component DHKTD1